MRMLLLGLAITWASTSGMSLEPREEKWTGWFSDGRCARTPAADELVRPNGTACVKRCLGEGSTPVFLSEQANAIFEVRGHPTVSEDVGYRLEVIGLVDYQAKTVAVRSVTRLSEVTAMCLLPKKKG